MGACLCGTSRNRRTELQPLTIADSVAEAQGTHRNAAQVREATAQIPANVGHDEEDEGRSVVAVLFPNDGSEGDVRHGSMDAPGEEDFRLIASSSSSDAELRQLFEKKMSALAMYNEDPTPKEPEAPSPPTLMSGPVLFLGTSGLGPADLPADEEEGSQVAATPEHASVDDAHPDFSPNEVDPTQSLLHVGHLLGANLLRPNDGYPDGIASPRTENCATQMRMPTSSTIFMDDQLLERAMPSAAAIATVAAGPSRWEEDPSPSPPPDGSSAPAPSTLDTGNSAFDMAWEPHRHTVAKHHMRQLEPHDFVQFRPDRFHGLDAPLSSMPEWLQELSVNDPENRFPAKLMEPFFNAICFKVSSCQQCWQQRLSEDQAWAIITYTSEMYVDVDARTPVKSWEHQIYHVANSLWRRYGKSDRPSGKTRRQWALFEPLAYHLDGALRALPKTEAVLFRAMTPKEEEYQFQVGVLGSCGGCLAASSFPMSAGALVEKNRQLCQPGRSFFLLFSNAARCVDDLSPFWDEGTHLHPLDTQVEVCNVMPADVLQALSPDISISGLRIKGLSVSLDLHLKALKELSFLYAPFLSAFISPLVKETPSCPTTFPLMQKVSEFLESPSKVLALMGPPGIGKTTCALWLSHDVHHDGWTWLYISLPMVRQPFSNNALVDHLRDSYGFPNDPTAFDELQRQWTVLLLDGLHEVKGQESNVNWWRANQLDNWERVKLIVMCQEEPCATCLGPDPAILHLQGFTDTQMEKYIYMSASVFSHSDQTVDEKVVQLVMQYASSCVVKHPFYNPLKLHFLTELLVQGKSAPMGSRAHLYEAWMEAWFQRAIAQLGHPLEPSEIWPYAEQLAWDLHSAATTHMIIGDRGVFPWFQCLPIRSHVYDPTSFFSFWHKSVQDYLVARYLFHRLESGMAADCLSQVTLTKDKILLHFLQDILDIQDSKELMTAVQGELFGYVLASITAPEDPPVVQCASNSITLLNLTKVSFHGLNMSGIHVPGAILHCADFRNCDLSGANLHQTDLQGSVLDFANLQGADLSGTIIGISQTLKHGAPHHAAASADCERILSIGPDGAPYLWVGTAGRGPRKLSSPIEEQNSLPGVLRPTSQVHAVALSADGEVFAVWYKCSQQRGTYQQEVAYISFSRSFGTEEHWLRPWPVYGIALSGDGRVLAVSSTQEQRNVCLIFQASRETPSCTLRVPGSAVTVIALSYDGTLLLTGHQNGGVTAWDALEGKAIRTFTAQHYAHRGAVACLAVSRSNFTVVSGANDKTACVWGPSGTLRHSLNGHNASVSCISICAKGRQVATGALDGGVYLWSAWTGELLHEVKGHTSAITVVQLSKDSRVLLSGSEGKVLVCSTPAIDLLRTTEGHNGKVQSLALSADMTTLVTGSDDCTMGIWRPSGELCHFIPHDSPVAGVAVSSDGLRCASAADKMVYVWKTDTAKLIRQMHGHTGRICALAMSGDGDIVASGSRDRTTRVWRVSTCEQIFVHKWRFPGTNSVAVSLDGSLVACAKEKVVFWWVQAEQMAVVEDSGRNVGMALCNDPSLFVKCHNRNIYLCEIATGIEIRAFTGHMGPVTCAALSGDGRRLVSGSADHTVCVWKAATGRLMYVLRGHTDTVTAVAISYDGSTVFSASCDATVRRWAPQSDSCEVWQGTSDHRSNPLALGCQIFPDTTMAGYTKAQLVQAGAKLQFQSPKSQRHSLRGIRG